MNAPLQLGPTRRFVALVALVIILVGGASAYVGTRIASDAGVTAASKTGLIQQQAQQRVKVPFLGPFSADKKHGIVCGPAVRLMEGALRNTKPPVRKTPAANCVGLATVNQLIKFQTRHHIPPSGIYGLRTHQALAHAYTNEQTRALNYLLDKRIKAKRVQTIGIVTAHAYAHRFVMGYCNHGSLSNCSLRGVWPAWPDVPRHADCSSYVSWVYYQSGLPSPNATSYPGNTTSLWQHGRAVTPATAALKVGDLVFYARNNSHVAIYIGRGLVSSHGQAGIKIAQWNYRSVYGVRRYF